MHTLCPHWSKLNQSKVITICNFRHLDRFWLFRYLDTFCQGKIQTPYTICRNILKFLVELLVYTEYNNHQMILICLSITMLYFKFTIIWWLDKWVIQSKMTYRLQIRNIKLHIDKEIWNAAKWSINKLNSSNNLRNSIQFFKALCVEWFSPNRKRILKLKILTYLFTLTIRG